MADRLDTLVLCLGIIGSLIAFGSGILHPKFKIYLVGLGTALGISSMLIQHYFVQIAKDRAQRQFEETSIGIVYALTHSSGDDISKLKMAAGELDTAFHEKYYSYFIIGYYLYCLDKWPDAEVYFHQSLDHSALVSRSDYMLAFIDSHDPKTKQLKKPSEWGRAADEVNSALADDDQYPSAYYLRATFEDARGNTGAAIADLQKSLNFETFRKVVCGDINAPDKILRHWQNIEGNPDFKALEDICTVVEGVSPADQRK